jgi:uncharacterized membrane-anchored protein
MEVLIFLFFWIAFAVIVGVAANTRGRDGAGWGFLAILISPLLAGLLLLALPDFRYNAVGITKSDRPATVNKPIHTYEWVIFVIFLLIIGATVLKGL